MVGTAGSRWASLFLSLPFLMHLFPQLAWASSQQDNLRVVILYSGSLLQEQAFLKDRIATRKAVSLKIPELGG